MAPQDPFFNHHFPLFDRKHAPVSALWVVSVFSRESDSDSRLNMEAIQRELNVGLILRSIYCRSEAEKRLSFPPPPHLTGQCPVVE